MLLFTVKRLEGTYRLRLSLYSAVFVLFSLCIIFSYCTRIFLSNLGVSWGMVRFPCRRLQTVLPQSMIVLFHTAVQLAAGIELLMQNEYLICNPHSNFVS